MLGGGGAGFMEGRLGAVERGVGGFGLLEVGFEL
jgi:hypothetical protein